MGKQRPPRHKTKGKPSAKVKAPRYHNTKSSGILAAEALVREATDAARQSVLKADLARSEALERAPRPKPRDPPGGMHPVDRGGGVKQGPPESPSQLPTEESRYLQLPYGREILPDLTPPERALIAEEREAKRSTRILVTKCRSHTEAAVDVLVEVMQRSTHAPSRVAAAKAVIEFGNGKAPERIEVTKVFSPEQMRAMAEEIVLRRARESVDGGKLEVVDAQHR